MVLPVSGFLPVPLPMMIPFMGAQSLVIGKMFGEGFQYGKRKISAMPNEEFNKLTFEDMMSNARSEMQASIPTMQAALQDMKPMVTTVVKEFLAYIELVAGVVTGTGGNKPPFHDVGEQLGGEIDQTIAGLLAFIDKNLPGIPVDLQAAGTPSGSQKIDLTPEKFPISEQLKEIQKQRGISVKGTTKGLVSTADHALRQKMGNKSRQSLRIKFKESSKDISRLTNIYTGIPKTISHSISPIFRAGKRPQPRTVQVTNPAKGIALRNIQQAQQWVIDIQKWFKLKGWSF